MQNKYLIKLFKNKNKKYWKDRIKKDNKFK